MSVTQVKELVKQVIRKELLKGDDPVSVATGETSRTPGSRVAFVKTKMENRQLTSMSGQLPDRMEDLVDGISEALAKIILSLQVKDTTPDNPLGLPVVIPVTNSPGLPSAGFLTPAIPTAPGKPNVTLTTIVDVT